MFNVPEATPDDARTTLCNIAEVMSGTINPSPKPMANNPGSIKL